MAVTNKTFADLITFTRSGATATRVNSAGLIETVAADTPRFDYDPVTLAAKGLLIEEARTNLITQSRDYSAVAWGKTAITVSACPDPSPTGATDAQTVTNSGGVGLLAFVHSGTAGVSYTFSVWMRRRSGTGTVAITDTNGNYVPQTLTSSWKRFTVTTSSSATTTIRAYIRVYTSGDEVDIYNSQLELGAFATSDIFTDGATVTRPADSASITGTDFSDWYNASEGTVYVDADLSNASGTDYLVQLASPTVTQGISYWVNNDPTDARFWVGAANIVISGSQPLGAFKVAFAFNDGDNGVSWNGSTANTSASTPPTDCDELVFSANGNSVLHIKDIRFYPTRLSNTELQELTS